MTLLRSCALLPLLWTLASAVNAEITFAENGEVTIPLADCEVGETGLTAKFKATRWGMYTLKAEGEATGLATVNGQSERQRMKGSLGVFYIAKDGPCVIKMNGETKGLKALKLVPAPEGAGLVMQKGEEAIELDARDCTIAGVRLCYEPNPKKLCVGYWVNPKDWVFWTYEVKTPGTYEVILTQGCGKGAGGSEAVAETAGAELKFTVKDTGGFQNWEDLSLGKVTFEKAGRHQLKVRVLKKARGIMDIRRIVLKPVGD